VVAKLPHEIDYITCRQTESPPTEVSIQTGMLGLRPFTGRLWSFSLVASQVIWVDAKKKECVGYFENDGPELRPKGALKMFASTILRFPNLGK